MAFFKSIFGNYLGLNRDGFIAYSTVGGLARGVESKVTLLGTSTLIPAKTGTFVLSSSGTNAYTIDPPVVGADVTIVKQTASTDTLTSASTTHKIGVNTVVATFTAVNQALRLVATSTLQWAIAANPQVSTAGPAVTFST